MMKILYLDSRVLHIVYILAFSLYGCVSPSPSNMMPVNIQKPDHEKDDEELTLDDYSLTNSPNLKNNSPNIKNLEGSIYLEKTSLLNNNLLIIPDPPIKKSLKKNTSSSINLLGGINTTLLAEPTVKIPYSHSSDISQNNITLTSGHNKKPSHIIHTSIQYSNFDFTEIEKWVCKFCNYKNENEHKVCSMCQRRQALKEGTRCRSDTKSMWTCRICETPNSDKKKSCAVCETHLEASKVISQKKLIKKYAFSKKPLTREELKISTNKLIEQGTQKKETSKKIAILLFEKALVQAYNLRYQKIRYNNLNIAVFLHIQIGKLSMELHNYKNAENCFKQAFNLQNKLNSSNRHLLAKLLSYTGSTLKKQIL